MTPAYTPTPEHLAGLGYTADPAHDVPSAHLAGYSRLVPAPVHPYYATLVIQARLDSFPGPHRGFWLTRYATKNEIFWHGYAAPTPLFFEQLLSCLGWPVQPDFAAATSQPAALAQ